uniref:non-specific serine/threonine protein kinase n=1 Tax=Salvator merianae TaxID=96440 RepID=A0A8D0BWR8_SALMN
MGSRRRPLGRSYSGNGPYSAYSAGQGSDGEDNGPVVDYRPDRRNYLLSVRPENSLPTNRLSPSSSGRSTFCAIIAQLTEETQPLFETTLKSYAVSEDADAKFTCIVTGYPVPEVTWYKDDEEMDRYCGLPKYEIFRHGNRHTLQLYKCKEEDAAIYQASARNNKGIVSCSGVLEVGTMSEYKIHQRWFAKLKRNAEAKLREIEQSRKRGKENVEVDQLRRVSPDRFQRKRRLTGEVGMRSGTEADKAKGKETLVNTPNLFSNNFITGRLEAEVTTNGDSSLESGEENSEGRTNGFLNYIYETVENIKNKPAAKEVSAKKKKKEEKNIVNAKQSVSRQEDEIQPTANGELRKPEPRERPDQVVGKPSSRPRAAPSDANVYFSLKDMYFDLSGKAKNELLASEAKDRGIAVPCPDVEEPVPAPGTALQRARPEEGQLEVFKAQEAARSETQEGKSTETLAAETDGDFSTTLQHPSWSSEPVIDAEGSLPPGEVSEISDESTLETDVQDPVGALETEVEAWPSSEENARQNILETDLVESPAPEVELPQFPQCEEETDSSLRIQEHPGDFQSASLEEQLHAHGPCEGDENEQEVQASENGTITPKAPSIQDSAQPETVMDENEEKEQQKKLVSSLKNYLLLLLKITESDKKKNGKKQEAKEEKGPPSAIPKHMSDVGIAGLTPRTSRKIFERVETNQLFQSAEQLQLTPRTSRKLTGMINQELLACKEGLGLEPESPPLPSVPSIVVGDVPDEQTRPPELSPVTSNEVPSALPSATPQELASGARRKIYLPKAKPPDEMESVAPESQGRSKRDSPTVSPQQGRRNATLLPSPAPASPPLEKRSPTLARKMATLEVPKIYEEPDEESTNVADSTLGPLENLEETTSEAQPVEPRKANDPFKAPQVIRKIRPEQFSDASGNLKLWCQFFNILSDSKLTWYKDEVPVADAKRSSGDEGQAALAIVQVSLKDCGVYQCTIQNEYGTDSTDLLLSAEVLSGFISKEEIEAGEEIEMTPMVFAKGLADSGFWGDKLFGRIMVEDLEVGQGFLWKACRARAIYGLEPVFESGHTGIIKVHNFIPFGGRSESTLVERNYDITIQECKIQNSSREYCKIFAAEARAVAGFGPVPEIIPLYLIYRPANNIPYATMEEDLPGQFESYCGRNGESSLAPGDTSEVGQKCCTFQHWLYQWTNGNFLVTDLEGVGWKVTNVRIATKTKGYQGLKESCSPGLLDHFAASHQCNYYCELLALKRLEVPQPPPKGKGSRSPVTGRKVSSANSSPQLQKKGLSSPQTSRKGSVSPKSTRKCPESGVAELVARPKAGDNGKGSRRH